MRYQTYIAAVILGISPVAAFAAEADQQQPYATPQASDSEHDDRRPAIRYVVRRRRRQTQNRAGFQRPTKRRTVGSGNHTIRYRANRRSDRGKAQDR
jgi:hypothetical protein